MQNATVTDDDTGKRVVNSSGVELGVITTVEDGVAHLEPDPGVTETVRSKLGWSEADGGDYTLEADRIDIVTADEVRVKSDR
mgnify:CR=1 FL=1